MIILRQLGNAGFFKSTFLYEQPATAFSLFDTVQIDAGPRVALEASKIKPQETQLIVYNLGIINNLPPSKEPTLLNSTKLLFLTHTHPDHIYDLPSFIWEAENPIVVTFQREEISNFIGATGYHLMRPVPRFVSPNTEYPDFLPHYVVVKNGSEEKWFRWAEIAIPKTTHLAHGFEFIGKSAG